jgi:hypothetical protein
MLLFLYQGFNCIIINNQGGDMRKQETSKKNMKLIFIAHSHKDHFLAERIKTLFYEVFDDIAEHNMYCSSFDNTRGKPILSSHAEVLKCLSKSVVSIILLTPNFIVSPNCNAEFGYLQGKNKLSTAIVLWFSEEKLTESSFCPWYLGDSNFEPYTEQSVCTMIDDIKNKTNLKLNNDKKGDSIKSFVESCESSIPPIPAGIDYNTMRDFLDACLKHNRTVFFNAQVSLEDWFNPGLQTHLALQDAVSSHSQIKHFVKNKKPKMQTLPDWFSTPSCRVVFVPQKRNKFIKTINNQQTKVQSLLDLTLIHLFMTTPLAIVTADQLADIIIKNFNGKPKTWFKTLSLPYYDEKKYTRSEYIKQIIKELEQVQIQAISRPYLESIDFAMLIEREQYQIWQGGVSDLPPQNLVYQNVKSSIGRRVFYEFGSVIEKNVFKPNQESIEKIKEARCPDMVSKNKEIVFSDFIDARKLFPDEEKIRKFHKLIASRHPHFSLFHKKGKTPTLIEDSLHIMKFVNAKYCALALLEQSFKKDIFEVIECEMR